jgi:hypothetical protein
VPLAVTVTISAAPAAPAASSAALAPASAASTPALFRPIAALAINRPVSPGLKGYCGCLTTTGADHGGARAHAAAPTPKTAIVMGMGGSVAAAAAPGRALLGLTARFAASRRRVAAFLKKLLLSGGENKFLTAIATRK